MLWGRASAAAVVTNSRSGRLSCAVQCHAQLQLSAIVSAALVLHQSTPLQRGLSGVPAMAPLVVTVPELKPPAKLPPLLQVPLTVTVQEMNGVSIPLSDRLRLELSRLLLSTPPRRA